MTYFSHTNAYLLQENFGHLRQESFGAIIISQTNVITDQDNFGVTVPAAYIHVQTADPIVLQTVGEFELHSVTVAQNPTFAERTLTVGTNTQIPKPQGATFCVITPPVNNTSDITLKGDPGDIGVQISSAQPTPFTLDPSQTTFYVNSSPSIVALFTFI